jgi:fatty-acyl-CoA synthase
VAGALSEVPGVKETNVYGVKVADLDGRAGMAGLVVGDGFDVKRLAAVALERLPAFARPVFLRLLPEIAVTGTFKYRKMDLVSEGFDPNLVRDPLYVLGDKGYQKLTKPLFAKVMSGEMRL